MNFLIICGLIILACILGIKHADKVEKEKKRKKLENETINYNTPDINTELTDEEYKKQVISLLRSNNVNLTELQNQLDKQDEKIKDIKFCINIICFIMVIPIIIGIIVFIIKITIGYNFLQNINETLNEIPYATAVVVDDEDNIIPNKEYHGQNVAH